MIRDNDVPKDNNDIYNMKLHERKNIDAHTTALRVPGGWIYITEFNALGDYQCVTTFVPLNNEFQCQP